MIAHVDFAIETLKRACNVKKSVAMFADRYVNVYCKENKTKEGLQKANTDYYFNIGKENQRACKNVCIYAFQPWNQQKERLQK